ncbi:MAG: serine/threonine protein phosphatase, partial [Gammaproteobacteria bacterium]
MSLLKKFVKILIIIALVYAVGRFVVVFKDSQLSGFRAPYIQMLTQDSVIIRWMTEDNELGIVRFGEGY